MAITPGSTIGILGGGQLGRMTAMAARSYGYRVQVLDPDPACPARVGYAGRSQLRLRPDDLDRGWSRPSGLHTSAPKQGASAPGVQDPSSPRNPRDPAISRLRDFATSTFEQDFKSRPLIAERAI